MEAIGLPQLWVLFGSASHQPSVRYPFVYFRNAYGVFLRTAHCCGRSKRAIPAFLEDFSHSTASSIAMTMPTPSPLHLLLPFGGELPDLMLPVTGPLTIPLERFHIAGDVLGSFAGLGWLYLSAFQLSSPETILAVVDFSSMLDFPPWTATVFVYAGLVLLVLGMMAWLGSHSLYRRAWGRRLAMSGGGLFVVGTAFRTFVDLLQYVLG